VPKETGKNQDKEVFVPPFFMQAKRKEMQNSPKGEKKHQKFSNRIGLNESQCKNCSWQVQLPRALMPKRQTNELYAHGYKVFNRVLN